MFSLTRNLVPSLVGLRAHISTSAARLSGADPMLELGPYPKTKEERIRAARKYNLIPEDYEPYDEGEAMGDYPMLKAVGAYNRDRYDDYDDVNLSRHYGEVFHRDADLYQWERIDPLAHEKRDLPHWIKFSTFIGIILVPWCIRELIEKYRIYVNHPWKKKYPGVKYYDFPE